MNFWRKRDTYIWILGALTGAACLMVGAAQGQLEVIWRKAVMICLECIGIVSDVREGEDQELVESLVQQTGAAYPHLLANNSIDQALLAGVTGVPTTFFFDGEGKYLGGVVGSAEKSTWEELIHDLLEES